MMDVLINFVNVYLVDFGVKIVLALICLLIGLKIVKVLVSKLGKGKAFSKVDPGVSSLILSGLKLVLNALVIIIVVQILGVPSATIIAAIGSCGLAVGLALQGGLSNIAGGVMIMLFKPFHYGDYIVTPVGEGVVQEIGIFYTKLVTVDSKLINIPNSVLSSSTVSNLSAMPTRGIDIDVAIRYDADCEAAKKALLKCAEESSYVLTDPAPIAFISAHGESSITVTLRVNVNGSDYWPARWELMERSVKYVAGAGVEIPYPQLDVHVKNQ